MKQIKEVFSDHSEALAHLIQEANRALATDFGINQSNNPKHSSFCEKNWVDADFERGERYFVLTEDSVPIGCVAYETPNRASDISAKTNNIRKAYLNRLSVLPEHQGKGAGTLLVKHIIEQAESDNIERISLGTISQHAKLQSWYEQLGFIKGDTKHFEHLPFDVTYMMYDLDNVK